MPTKPVIALLITALAAPTFAGDGIREGKWEYQVQMQFGAPGDSPAMPDMPKLPEGFKLPGGMKMPSFGPQGISSSFEACITDQQLVPKDDKAAQKCEVTEMQRSGSSVRWKMHCTDPKGDMDGVGKAVYSGNTMSSEMTLKGSHDGQPTNMSQKMTGRYLGPCS